MAENEKPITDLNCIFWVYVEFFLNFSDLHVWKGECNWIWCYRTPNLAVRVSVCVQGPGVCSCVHVVVVCFDRIFFLFKSKWFNVVFHHFLKMKIATWWQSKQNYQFHPSSVSFSSSLEAQMCPGRNKLPLVRFPQPGWSPPSNTAWPPYSFYLQLGPSQRCGATDGWRKEVVRFEDKEKRKPLPNSGFWAAVIFSQSRHNYPGNV